MNELSLFFRREFSDKVWMCLTINFPEHRAYHESGIDQKTSVSFSYCAYWKGLRIERSFQPLCREDVIAEAWKLGGVLVAWENNPL